METGWSLNIAKPNQKTHFYHKGKSLCGKAVVMAYMKLFDHKRYGSKFFNDCQICCRKFKKLTDDENYFN